MSFLQEETVSTGSRPRAGRGAEITEIEKPKLKMKTITIAFLAVCSLTTIQFSSAATIPAGTILVVRTNETISSDDSVGKTFAAQLASDVVMSGLRGPSN